MGFGRKKTNGLVRMVDAKSCDRLRSALPEMTTHPFSLENGSVTLQLGKGRFLDLIGMDDHNTGIASNGKMIRPSFSDPFHTIDNTQRGRVVLDVGDYFAGWIIGLPIGWHLENGHSVIIADYGDSICHNGEVNDRAC